MLTPEGLVLQLGFMLLIAAVLAPRLRLVQLFAGAAALVWLPGGCGSATWSPPPGAACSPVFA